MKILVTVVVGIVVIVIMMFILTKKENQSSVKDNKSEISNTNLPSSTYLSKYAGGYTVKVPNVSTDDEVELYLLHKNSKAKWMWIVNDGYGNANIKSEKTGTWTAELNKIIINIRGNTGTIKEEFIMKNGQFHDTFTNRYLERTK